MNLTGLLEGKSGGPENMGRDLDLWRAAEAGRVGARVYGWDGPWVSLGRFQSSARALLPGAPVQWVSRPTGGRAVLHGHDVTIGFAAPLTWLGLPENSARRISSVYRAATRPVLAALRACGLEVSLVEEAKCLSGSARSADCFASAFGLDIVDSNNGSKVCGCALRVGQEACLLQASLPAGEPLVDPALVFERPSPSAWVSLNPVEFATAFKEALDLNQHPVAPLGSISVL